MKTFKEFLEQSYDIPLLTIHPIKDNSLIVNEKKWILGIPPSFANFNILVNDKKINCMFTSKKVENSINLYFPRTNNHVVLGYMILSNFHEDPLSKDYSGKPRFARFPSFSNKKERIYKKDDLIFGTSEQKTMTHALRFNLSEISNEIETYFNDKSEYENKIKSKTEFNISEEDKKIIIRTLERLVQHKHIVDVNNKYAQKINRLISIFNGDKNRKLSNIKTFNVMKIPPKNEIVKAVNEELNVFGNKKITDFNQIEEIVIEMLKNKRMFNAKQILDKSGFKPTYIFIVGVEDENGFREKYYLADSFIEKYRNIFITKWEEISKLLDYYQGSGNNEDLINKLSNIVNIFE